MNWTPEIIGGLTVGVIGVIGAMNKRGIINLPISRNNYLRDLKSSIERHSERLDRHKISIEKGENKFETIRSDIAKLSTAVEVTKEKIDLQEKYFNNIMTPLLKEIREKL